MKLSKKGFSLVEILVAIAVISVLAGLLLVSIGGARATARDAKRKADLEQIRSALEMYWVDTGLYPTGSACDSSRGSGAGACDNCQSPCPLSGSDWGGEINAKLEGNFYIEALPKDPLNNRQYYYFYEPADPPTSYTLGARLEATGVCYKVRNP